MPPALDIDRLVQGPGAGFTVRDYPPQLIGVEHCGNPIDGKAYYFILSRQTRATTRYVKWEAVERAAAAAGVEPSYDQRNLRLDNSIDRDVAVRHFLAETYPDSPALREILFARADVTAGPIGQLKPVAPGRRIEVSRADASAGYQLRVQVPSLGYLDALHKFFASSYMPSQAAAKREIYPSPDRPTHLIREKQGARARRGLRPAGGDRPRRGIASGGAAFARAEFIAGRKKPARLDEGSRVEHSEFGAGKLEAYATTPMPDGAKAAIVRFDMSRSDLTKVPVASLRPGAEQVASAAAAEKLTARWVKGERDLPEPDQVPALSRQAREALPPLPEEVEGRARRPMKASVATSKGDLRVDYATAPADGEDVIFYKTTQKGAAALNQFDYYKPFGPYDFDYSGPSTTLHRALVTVGPFSAEVAAAFIVSGCIRVNGTITIDPNAAVGAARLSVRCEPKAGSDFFSWVPSYLPPRDDETECHPKAVHAGLIEAARKHPGNFSVFMTLNPVLFEYTRAFWASWRSRSVNRAVEGILANAQILRDIDAVGRYGTALRLGQLATARTPNSEVMKATLAAFFAPALQERYFKALLSGSDRSKSVFAQLWPLGAPYAIAREQVQAFIADPAAWVHQLKRSVIDRAVPRILRTYQTGTPNRRVWRLKPSSNPKLLQRALYRAMHNAELLPNQVLSATEETRLLRRFQAQPPSFAIRRTSGRMDTVVPAPLPATGQFDAATVALLNRVLNAVRIPPRGARPIPERLDLTDATTADRLEAYLGTLTAALREIDGALAELGEPPYVLRASAGMGPGLNLQRPGTKRRRTLED